MTESNWKASLAAVLASEGGNDDDPADHGGRTSRGITQREYDAWRRERHQPGLDVWQAPQSDIEAIYHGEYWEPYCDQLPVGLDYCLFNTRVLAGPHTGAVLLQRALGVTADGRIGAVTRQAAQSVNAMKAVNAFAEVSRAFYLGLHQPRFTKGWLNRVAFVQKTALGMIEKGAH
jgi:lysozyme family protein